MRAGCRRSERGFTLVEIIIAVTILAMMGAVTLGTFARSMQARDQAEEVTAHYHQIRQAMLRMAREISMAFISVNRNCEDPRTDTVFLAKRSGGGMRLDFNSFSHFRTQADANESDQQELSYFVGTHPDEPARRALFRRSQARIDDEPEEGGEEQVLAEDVSELSFEFYDAKDDRWVDDWDTNHSDFRNRLPMFVAITIKTKDPFGEEEKLVTKTRIFVSQRIQIAGTGQIQCMD